MATGWLVRLGVPVTEEAVALVAPHVDVGGERTLLETQAFARLVRLGQAPTAAAVRGEAAALEVSQARRRQLKEESKATETVELDVPVAGEQAARFVAQRLELTGTGPSWGELREHMGWPSRPVTLRALRLLQNAGWLTSTPEEGSLRPGPLYNPPGRDSLV